MYLIKFEIALKVPQRVGLCIIKFEIALKVPTLLLLKYNPLSYKTYSQS